MTSAEDSSPAADSNTSTPDQSASSLVADFPTAATLETGTAAALVRQSRIWWITLFCLLLAAWLTWNSLPERGPEIVIRFPEGHGLKAGDAVRYRGIEVGTVTSVTLTDDLNGISAAVMLKPGNGSLDQEGTRFWIVRPQLSLTGVSGLETAVGAKYIGVSPGDPAGPHRTTFEGLGIAPPDELAAGGLELILRSNQRHGISAGAPVTWRGVDVGQVLSVNLSPDARHVDIGIRVDRAYRRLVRSSSKFWITSGFAMDVGLTGVKLNAESLSTIVRGGISFITPAESGMEQVNSGRVFRLVDAPKEEWLKSAATVPFVDIRLPKTVAITGQRTSSFLGIARVREFSQTGLLIGTAQGAELWTAALPALNPDAEANSEATESTVLADFTVLHPSGESQQVTGVPVNDVASQTKGTVRIPLPDATPHVTQADFRTPTGPEECLIVRSAVVDNQPTPVIQAVDLQQISAQDSEWLISGSEADFSQWHGAPVVAISDGRIIGLLLSESGGAKIIPYAETAP